MKSEIQQIEYETSSIVLHSVTRILNVGRDTF